MATVQDMDLRAEKEKQRSALIKLQELSAADKEFADKCEAVVNKDLGLRPPVLSRFEMQANPIKFISRATGDGKASAQVRHWLGLPCHYRAVKCNVMPTLPACLQGAGNLF